MSADEDRISDLPDELLHRILVRLGSARAAVRTGVLSRRWRHILGPLPELFLNGDDLDAPPPPPLKSSLDNIDAALAACDAPILRRLDIGWALSSIVDGRGIPAVRATRWLRLASEHVVDELHIDLPRPEVANGEEEEAVLQLPACEAVTSMNLILEGSWRIQPPSAGLFAALTNLTIHCGRMDGAELTALVCTQCPCLVRLKLSLMLLVNASDVSIRSDSLQSLRFTVWKTDQSLQQFFVMNRLEIVAPRMEKLSLSTDMDEVRISAPKLAELLWNGGIYDSCRHMIDGVGSRLQVLHPGQNASLMQQFEEVDELRLFIFIGRGISSYERFLNETNRLPKCKILSISSVSNHHGLVPGMLHLLRSCNGTRKVSLFDRCDDHPLRHHPCLQSCPCRFEKSHKIDDIPLSSLVEVEITSYTSSPQILKFVEQLSRCNAAQLKKVVMKHRMKMTNPIPPPTKEAREKIYNMFQPNVEVEFYVDV